MGSKEPLLFPQNSCSEFLQYSLKLIYEQSQLAQQGIEFQGAQHPRFIYTRQGGPRAEGTRGAQ